MYFYNKRILENPNLYLVHVIVLILRKKDKMKKKLQFSNGPTTSLCCMKSSRVTHDHGNVVLLKDALS